MFGLSFVEIIVLLVMALVLIGPKQLPEVARTLGKLINDVRRTANGFVDDMKNSIELEKQHQYQNQQQSLPSAESDNHAHNNLSVHNYNNDHQPTDSAEQPVAQTVGGSVEEPPSSIKKSDGSNEH